MDKLREILTLINSGQRTFRPKNDSNEAMQSFQFIAKCLMYAKDENLIDGINFHKESHTGNRWYDAIIVLNGLTYQGEQFLNGNNILITRNPIVIKELNMGDNFSNISNSTIVNCSDVDNSFNKITSEEKKTLAEVAKEIQMLLKQLEKTNPTATDLDKIAYIDYETSASFKSRASSALKACGETAIDEFLLENKYLKVVKATIKGWLQVEN